MKWENFAPRKGTYFAELAAAPKEFVRPREDVKSWMKSLRDAHKKRLFLLTNSSWDYADLVMEAAFGSDWHTLFDLLVYRAAKKCEFFNHHRPFVPFDRAILNEGKACCRQQSFRTIFDAGCREFVDGNIRDLCTVFGDDAEVVYFGDDLNGDISVTHRASSWHTVAVVEELGAHTSENTVWGPILSFQSDVFEPRRSCSLQSFNADDVCDTPRASHILEMLAATADFTLPDLATLASYPIDYPFEHADVMIGVKESAAREVARRSVSGTIMTDVEENKAIDVSNQSYA